LFDDILATGETTINENNTTSCIEFVKKGWVTHDGRGTISLPCPISREVLFLEMYGMNRPKSDSFDNLSQFILAFLSCLSSNFISKSLSLSIDKKGTLLESFWCFEFYRIGYPLLRQDTYIHSQVQKVDDKVIDGKIDFIIKNGNRSWAIEFLISGNELDTRYKEKVTVAQEHCNRFVRTYKDFSLFEYLVIDFRNCLPNNCENDMMNSHYWLVCYSNNSNVLTLKKPTEKCDITLASY